MPLLFDSSSRQASQAGVPVEPEQSGAPTIERYVQNQWNAAMADYTLAWQQTLLQARPGMAVVAPPGISVVAAQLNIPDGVTVKGNAAGGIVMAAPGSSISVFAVSPLGQRANIAIRNLTIDGNKANVAGGNGINLVAAVDFTVRGVTVLNPFNVGILVDANGAAPSQRGRITDCAVLNPGGHGIALSGTAGLGSAGGPQRTVVANNLIIEPGTSGAGAGINVSQSRGCSVTGNVIYRASTAVTGYGGIRVSNGSENCSITGNSIDGTSRGIYLVVDAGAGDGPIQYNTVAGNTIQRCMQHGILSESPHNTITGNTVRDCLRDAGTIDGAIRVSNANSCTVVGNTVIDTTGVQHDYGIKVTGTSDFCVVDGNVIEGWITLPMSVSGTSSKVGPNANALTVDRPSGATLALRDSSDYVNVTGSTNISGFSGQFRAGRIITLKINAALTIVNGAALKLAGSVNFVVPATGAMIQFVYDAGTAAWCEISRTVF